MDYGTFCSSRETFGISINKDLLGRINTTNCSKVNLENSDELISLTLRILTGLSWLCIVLVGTIANISVLFVIGYIKSMRTIPNWLLFNLAVADCLMTLVAFPLLGVFQTFFYPLWQLPNGICYVINCFTHIGALASGASLAAISIHRFIVIRFPKRVLITKRHLAITIALIWMIAIGGSASSMLSAGVIGMIRPVAGKMYLTRLCIQVNPSEGKEDFQLAFRCSMYVTYALFLFLLYTIIGCHIYKTKTPGQQITAGKSVARKRQAVRMLATATIVMIFSYFPYMILVGKLLFAKSGYYSPVFAVEILCNIISALNHVVNPFIYCALSSQFREGFKKWFAYLRRNSNSVGSEFNKTFQQANKVSNVILLEGSNIAEIDNGTGDEAVGKKLTTSCSQITLESLLKVSSATSLNQLEEKSQVTDSKEV